MGARVPSRRARRGGRGGHGIERVDAARRDPDRWGLIAQLLVPPAGLRQVVAVRTRNLGTAHEARLLSQRPSHAGASHRSTEEVARFDRSRHGVAGMPHAAVSSHTHQKLRCTILGDAIGRRCHLDPLTRALELADDPISPERRPGRDRESLICGPELREGHRRVAKRSGFLSTLWSRFKDPPQRVTRKRRFECAQGTAPDDRLGIHRLARTIDVALGEQGRGHRQSRRGPGGSSH